VNESFLFQTKKKKTNIVASMETKLTETNKIEKLEARISILEKELENLQRRHENLKSVVFFNPQKTASEDPAFWEFVRKITFQDC
jgi:hypothetical protein